jgi:hypothetical protein
MTDFKVIRAGTNYRRLRTDDIAARSRQGKDWLSTELEKPFAGRTVVITHHSPLVEVGDHEHDGHLTAAYCNNWPSLVMKADMWFFGHTHHAIDTEIGSCRLISNPKGYPLEQTGFDACKIVEI